MNITMAVAFEASQLDLGRRSVIGSPPTGFPLGADSGPT
jgi:hypothetical protein